MTYRYPALARTAAWILLLAAPAISRADVVFTNFGAASSYDLSNTNVVGNGFDGNNYAEGDTFTATTNGIFGSLDIALSCIFACSDSFTVSLDASNAGMPGAVIESFAVSGASLGVLGNNNAPLVFDSVLNPLLTAGTQYW